MRTILTISIISLIFFLIYYKKTEFYVNSQDYYINVFSQKNSKNTNKYILYHDNNSAIESNNNKCIWNSLSQTYTLESIIKKSYHDKFNNLKITKDKDKGNIYKIGNKYYIKHINDNLYHLSLYSDFHIIDKIIHHNNINNVDTISIKNPNDNSSDDILFSKKIKDNIHSKYKSLGNQYKFIFNKNILDPLQGFNIFFLIKEIHRLRYIADFDKK